MKKLFAFVLVALLAAPIHASVGPKNAYAPSVRQINATTIAGAETPSFDIQNAHNSGVWGVLVVYVSVVDTGDGVTALNMTCTASDDNNTTAYTLADCDVSSGVCTTYMASWTFNPRGVTSPKRWVWRVDIEGLEDIKCTFSDTGGGAGDTLTVYTALAVK